MEHPPTSIEIESDIQDDDSTISRIIKPIKSIVVTPQKLYQTVLPSDNTTNLQNSEYNLKTNKVNQDIEEEFQQAKTQKKEYNTDENDKPSDN